jgi:hypothetical protein
MSRLVQVLYPLADGRRTLVSLLRWWESRRLFYNLVVGATGMVTLIGISILSLGELGLPLLDLAGPVVAYGVAANLCYSLGWGLEMLARIVWGDDAPDIGPLLFRQGLIFSVGLTLIPLFAATLLTFVRVAMWVFS